LNSTSISLSGSECELSAFLIFVYLLVFVFHLFHKDLRWPTAKHTHTKWLIK
jgi:hypothetical protein